jgi:hypothetical protein
VLGECFGKEVPIDMDVLIAGSLLADCGKPLEFDKDSAGKVIKGHFGDMLRHPFSGVAMSRARPTTRSRCASST